MDSSFDQVHELGKVQANDELKADDKINGYLTRNQNKRLPILLEEVKREAFAKMKNSSIIFIVK